MRSAVRLAAFYAIFAGAWVAWSDRLLEGLTSDVHQLTVLQTYKGAVFIVVSALLLFVALSRELHAREEHRKDLEDAEHRLRHQLERSRALHASAQAFSRILDFQELANEVARRAVEEFGAAAAWICRIRENEAPQLVSLWPSNRHLPDNRLVPAGLDAAPREIEDAFLVLDDPDPDTKAPEDKPEKGIAAPVAFFFLTSRDNPSFVLAIEGDDHGTFTEDRLDLFRAYAHQAAVALEGASLFTERAVRIEHLKALRRIDAAVASSVDLFGNLYVVLEQVTLQLGAAAADIMLLHREKEILTYGGRYGFRSAVTEPLTLELEDDPGGRVVRERRTVVKSLQGLDRKTTFGRMVAAERFETYVGVPLIAKGRVQGVLEVFHRNSFVPDAEWMDFLNTLAGQAAIAIENGLLFSDLERTNAELTRAYDKTLEGWSHALELRDIETYDHTRRVTDRSLRLARAMGFKDEDLIHLRRGALLHDIGKLAIPDRILLKPGPLNGEEWQIMCRHPVYAYELLVRIPFLRPAIDIPYCHHERWDGKGYPRGLQGEEIPLSARIFAVVDVADALHSERRYSRRWPKDKIHDYIANQAGRQFDPAVVEKFLTLDGGDFFETFFESGYETDDSSSIAATHWRPA